MWIAYIGSGGWYCMMVCYRSLDSVSKKQDNSVSHSLTQLPWSLDAFHKELNWIS